MEAIKSVIFTACLCAVLTSAVQTLSPERMKTELRLVCGLILMICAASQIIGAKIDIGSGTALLEDDESYSLLLDEFGESITGETAARLEADLTEKLKSSGINAEKVVIVCTLDEYNYVKADKACIYLAAESAGTQTNAAKSAAELLLPGTEIEVMEYVG